MARRPAKLQQADVERYREQLLEMRDRLREEVADLAEGIPDLAARPGDISNLPTHNADRDAEGLDIEAHLEENQAAILNEVEAALDRIDAREYGRCEDCGTDIPRARLSAIPYTVCCTACAEKRQTAVRGA